MGDIPLEIPDIEYKHSELPLYICRFKKIGSTQIWAYNNVDKLVDDNKLSPNMWTLVTADQMTSGIGSEDSKTGLPHKWYTLEGKNLNLTYIALRLIDENNEDTSKAYNNNSCSLKLNHSIKNIGFYILSLSLVVCKVIEKFGIKNAKIKWINDIFVNNKKIGGVICKKLDKIYTFNNMKYEPFVIGIGVNIFHREKEIPVDVEHPATSLILENKSNQFDINLDDISEKMHFNVIKCISKLNSSNDAVFSERNVSNYSIINSKVDFVYLNKVNITIGNDNNNVSNYSFKKSILDEINERLLYKGKMVSITENKLLNEHNNMGMFVGIDENGYAIIKTTDGNINLILTHGRMKCLTVI
ncbi:biotin (acetyl-carboxylase) ligase [Cryptosporidium bovis]|uniref:biotin (acetyl-carboxylase) ligase n=1 Tax=Cryptosporidium bovis TaxID=310047 RepID=UPI00351A7046|nr:biotin (acetyl-carboxylase) ligase [Cryptosporidium bovis]